MMKKINLMCFEDNSLLRNDVLTIAKTNKDFNILVSSNSVEKILSNDKYSNVDIFLIDREIVSENSVEIVQSLREEFPLVKIIVMNINKNQYDLLQLIKAGANGFVLKNTKSKDLLRILQSITKGATILPSLLVNSLFSQVVENAVESKVSVEKTANMTKREQEVIKFVSDGLSNKEIGQNMHVSTYTVKSHIHNIMEKLALHTRLDIANFSYTNHTIKAVSGSISIAYKD